MFYSCLFCVVLSLLSVCINYANEKLQQHFNNFVFKLEQAEYLSEGIDVASISFNDNLDTLQLIEARPSPGIPAGIFAMLDEELLIPRGSDEALIQKMHAKFAPSPAGKGATLSAAAAAANATGGGGHKSYGIIKQRPNSFVIFHYGTPFRTKMRSLRCNASREFLRTIAQFLPSSSSCVFALFASRCRGVRFFWSAGQEQKQTQRQP